MSVADQIKIVLASVQSLENTLAAAEASNERLTDEVARLTAEVAALTQNAPPAPAWGFVANDADPPAAFAPALRRVKADGGAWLRLWHGSFGPLSAANAAILATAAAAGVNVILCVQPKDTAPADLGTPDFDGFVARNAAALKNVAYVEAGNELNLNQFRPDDLGGDTGWHGPYVDRWLRPLSAALATLGVRTLCTSVTDTYHPQNYAPQYAALLAAGAGDCCDGLAVHAYFLPQSLQTLSTILSGLTAAWAKPLFVTECNVMTRGLTEPQWQQQLGPYLAVLRQAGVAGLTFYRGFAKPNGKWAWPVLFDAAGAPTADYGTFVAAMTPPAITK